jgi:hypothetical protein
MEQLTRELQNIADCARYKDEFFDPDNYKWVLGRDIFYELEAEAGAVMINNRTTFLTLFGIKVEFDYTNPKTMQLWKNITIDL